MQFHQVQDAILILHVMKIRNIGKISGIPNENTAVLFLSLTQIDGPGGTEPLNPCQSGYNQKRGHRRQAGAHCHRRPLTELGALKMLGTVSHVSLKIFKFRLLDFLPFSLKILGAS